MSYNYSCLLGILCITLTMSESMAAGLIFEPATGTFGDGGFLPAGYGDRITSAVQDGFKYDLTGGATPNVVSQFGSSDALVDIFTWSSNYGDLAHVVYAREPVPFEFRLVADSG